MDTFSSAPDEERLRALAAQFDQLAAKVESYDDLLDAIHFLSGTDELFGYVAIAFNYRLQTRSGLGVSNAFVPMATLINGSSFPSSLQDIPQTVLDLWDVLARYASEPLILARLHHLLFTRRVGNGRDRASQAANAYLRISERAVDSLDRVEVLAIALDL